MSECQPTKDQKNTLPGSDQPGDSASARGSPRAELVSSNLVVANGVAWKVMPNGGYEAASPGECAREIDRLRAALERIANAGEGDDDYYRQGRIAREALRGADEPKASPVLERSADRVQFLHRWMRTANPNFGGATPLSMLKAGRGVRLADFLEEAHEANGGDAEETSAAHKPGCWKLHSPSGNGKCNCGAENGSDAV